VLEIGRLLWEQFTCSEVQDTGASEFGDEVGLETQSGTSKPWGDAERDLGKSDPWVDLASDTFVP